MGVATQNIIDLKQYPPPYLLISWGKLGAKMAKRFTDSNKFRDVWYRSLKPKHKCLWEFLLSECSLAGMIELDFDAMSFHIGEKITIDDINALGDRVCFIEDNKIFIPKFISFQQGVLNRNNNAHKNIFKELEKYNIDESLENIELQSPSLGATEGLQSPTSKGKGKGKGNSKNNISKNRANFENEFENFWEHYTPIKCNGRFVAKGNKEKAKEKFIKILEKGKTDYETIRRGLEQYLRHCQANNQLTCGVTVWLNQERWLDDYGSTVDSKGGLRERQEPKSLLAIHAEIEDEIRHRPDLQGEWD